MSARIATYARLYGHAHTCYTLSGSCLATPAGRFPLKTTTAAPSSIGEDRIYLTDRRHPAGLASKVELVLMVLHIAGARYRPVFTPPSSAAGFGNVV
jgi:hypothetical protein